MCAHTRTHKKRKEKIFYYPFLMVIKPPLEHNMGMSHRSSDDLELPLLYIEGFIRLERD